MSNTILREPKPGTPEQRHAYAVLLNQSRLTFEVDMEEYTPELAHLQAATGAAYMDIYCPGYVETTDLDILDLAHGDACVLGQHAHCLTKGEVESNTVTSYGDALDYLRPPTLCRWEIQRGFDVPYGYSPIPPIRYEMLTIAWKEQIRMRLEQA